MSLNIDLSTDQAHQKRIREYSKELSDTLVQVQGTELWGYTVDLITPDPELEVDCLLVLEVIDPEVIQECTGSLQETFTVGVPCFFDEIKRISIH